MTVSTNRLMAAYARVVTALHSGGDTGLDGLRRLTLREDLDNPLAVVMAAPGPAPGAAIEVAFEIEKGVDRWEWIVAAKAALHGSLGRDIGKLKQAMGIEPDAASTDAGEADDVLNADVDLEQDGRTVFATVYRGEDDRIEGVDMAVLPLPVAPETFDHGPWLEIITRTLTIATMARDVTRAYGDLLAAQGVTLEDRERLLREHIDRLPKWVAREMGR